MRLRGRRRRTRRDDEQALLVSPYSSTGFDTASTLALLADDCGEHLPPSLTQEIVEITLRSAVAGPSGNEPECCGDMTGRVLLSSHAHRRSMYAFCRRCSRARSRQPVAGAQVGAQARADDAKLVGGVADGGSRGCPDDRGATVSATSMTRRKPHGRSSGDLGDGAFASARNPTNVSMPQRW